MPESHPIGGINHSHGIIAPAAGGMGLRAVAAEHYGFALAEVARRVSLQASSITNRRECTWAGRGIADRRVAAFIHRDAGHPAPQAVIAIGPGLLLHRCGGKIAASHIELVPANPCWAGAVRVGTNGAGRPQRFGATKVLVNHRRHDFITQGIQPLRGSLLRHEERSRVCESVNEPVNRNLGVRRVVGADAESGICRRYKINMEKPRVDLSQGHAAAGRAVYGQHHFISTCGWRIPRAKVRSNKAIRIAHAREWDGKRDRVGRAASEHRRTIERKSAHTNKARIKQVDCQEIGILGPAVVPHRELRVVAKLVVVGRINLDRVEGPRAGHGVGALRHTDALPE
jgi:hypothetical protein